MKLTTIMGVDVEKHSKHWFFPALGLRTSRKNNNQWQTKGKDGKVLHVSSTRLSECAYVRGLMDEVWNQ